MSAPPCIPLDVVNGLVRCVHPGIEGHVSFGTVLNVDYDPGLMQSYMDVEDLEGRVLASSSGPRRVGVVGLGIGTLAAYGREGDVYRFYELDPEVEELAREHFTFLAECKAQAQVAIGDGRLLLEREADRGFDVLVLDAFSSDAVPVHLLTLEAFAIYRRHLAPGGVIAVNITNHHLELAPVVVAAARANGWHWVHIETNDDLPNRVLHAEWLILSDTVRSLPQAPLDPPVRELPAWTDDFSNLFRILK